MAIRKMSIALPAILAMLAAPPHAGAARLEPALETSMVFNGIAVSSEGRRFSPFKPQAPGQGFQLGEWVDGRPRAYPDARWNGWMTGEPGEDRFVGVNAVRVGPDGSLWVVDSGAIGIGGIPLIGGPKLVQIDLATDTVARVYPLGGSTWPTSYIDDVRFKGRTAYLTDAGAPGIVLLDLDAGTSRRVLEGDPSAAQREVLTADGKQVIGATGLPVVLNADQIEISPDGRWLYYQPITGPMSRIETRWLDDESVSDDERATHVERFADTGDTGGTAMDADGNLYASDLNGHGISKITPDGRVATLVQDPRLVWVDAMWIDDDGGLWLPAAQLERTAALNGGESALEQPSTIYRMALGVKPLRN